MNKETKDAILKAMDDDVIFKIEVADSLKSDGDFISKFAASEFMKNIRRDIQEDLEESVLEAIRIKMLDDMLDEFFYGRMYEEIKKELYDKITNIWHDDSVQFQIQDDIKQEIMKNKDRLIIETVVEDIVNSHTRAGEDMFQEAKKDLYTKVSTLWDDASIQKKIQVEVKEALMKDKEKLIVEPVVKSIAGEYTANYGDTFQGIKEKVRQEMMARSSYRTDVLDLED